MVETVDSGLLEVREMLKILPRPITTKIEKSDPDLNFTEIIVDLDQQLQLRYSNKLPIRIDTIVKQKDLDHILERLPVFRDDERVGIPSTLHRISRVPDKYGNTIGFTFRIGRCYEGSIELIKDVVNSRKNILIIGAPGAGKTTLLRQICKHLSISLGINTVVVDKSSEIGGESNPPHKAIGYSRRFQVPANKSQAEVLIFALESHFPQSIIVDEISTHEEATAVKTIAQRGVQIIATAHGKKLEDIIKNPPLSQLIGGVSTVTLGDDEAKRRGTSKSVQERQAEPTFDMVIEIINFEQVSIHYCVKDSVDAILYGGVCIPETRMLVQDKPKVLIPQKIALPVAYTNKEYEPTTLMMDKFHESNKGRRMSKYSHNGKK